MQDETNPVIAMKAPVAPRARRPDSDVALRLEQLILPYVQSSARGVIYIIAPAGWGKTTALNHLRAVLPADANVACFDDPQYDHWMNVVEQKLVLLTTTKFLAISPLERFELAGWTQDDCFEYLANTHREKCASVMKRLTGDPLFSMLDGSPAHLRAVMDEMAGHDAIGTIGQAIRSRTRRHVPLGPAREKFTMQGAASLANQSRPPPVEVFQSLGLSDCSSRFCAHPASALALGAEWVAMQLDSGVSPQCLNGALRREAIAEIASTLRGHSLAIEQLHRIIARRSGWGVPTCASIALAVDPHWRPDAARGMQLGGALLRGAQWKLLNLRSSSLLGTDLGHSDLSGADLSGANASGIDLRYAILTAARLERAMLDHADLSGADLRRANMADVRLHAARLTGANAAHAQLNRANLTSATLDRADFGHADLSKAQLVSAQLDAADFRFASLEEALLASLRMSGAVWTGARFRSARIRVCDLSGMQLPDVDFESVDFQGSDLTATSFPRGRFFRAKLCATGLADIDWPHADLRNADFTHASFHMGSSRSGLVGSIIPCEGSKTGFYTDDYNEQDYKSPEEIRKANLCGADLRGAIVDKADWYLVDLRGAKYTQSQAEHFARRGAILHSRVAD